MSPDKPTTMSTHVSYRKCFGDSGMSVCAGNITEWSWCCTSRAPKGMTLLELVVVLAILGVLASISVVAYNGYIDTAKVTNAEKQIRMISLAVDEYYSDYKSYPASLAAVGMNKIIDPWGNPYHYLNIATANTGDVRKDHNLVPLNTDYDLYSSGKDGHSVPPLTGKSSLDDVVRANNGGFVGLATDY